MTFAIYPQPAFDAPDKAKDLPPGVGAHAVGGNGRPNPTVAMKSGIEGREREFGEAVGVLMKTFMDTMPYVHEFNDAVVKSHLSHIQFAKNHGLLKEMIEDDQETMSPMLTRVKKSIEQSGNKELAMIAMFERTSCFYQMVATYHSENGKRTWKSPFGLVLDMGTRIGQFDMTEQDIHDIWFKPRLYGYADQLGVKIKITDMLDADKMITCVLAE
ncbi:MAG: hypothetical protein EXR10_08915 [Alphaproteobacteria bacterium]|nr:hypothetical protein [Alphaproteobacteria bacterium]PHX99430.1 MAG: hypothetical protein CK529_09485 [Rhodospirillaceae bacterium]